MAGVRRCAKAVAGRPVKRPVTIPSDSDPSDSTLPAAEEEDSEYSED